MISITRKTDFAMVALARLVEQQANNGGPLSARQIAQQYSLPLPLVTKAMKSLQRAGIVRSIRGVRGGYLLTGSPAWISVADVIEALEGPVKAVPCCEKNEEDACLACHVVAICPITVGMRRLNQRIDTLLRQITLKDLISAERIDIPGAQVAMQ